MGNNSHEQKIRAVQAFIKFDADNLRSLIIEIVQEEMSKIKIEPQEPLDLPTLSPKQAAVKIGLSESTIRRRMKSGDLKFSRVGKKGKLIRIKESDLHGLLVERKMNGISS
ncbi:MAG: helix-turn-helix domain-containing protein [Cyclobacteriaceae bacterium]